MELLKTTLSNTLTVAGEKFCTTEYKTIIEDHLSILINQSTPRTIENNTALQFRNNFYGLLRELKIKPNYWWVFLRINELHSPLEYQGEYAIRVITPAQIERFNQQYRTVSNELF